MPLKLDLRRKSGVMRSRLRYKAWSCTSEGRQNRERLLALKDKYEGRRCFVMGNGPSLLKCDLNRLAGEVTIVSNAHYLIWDKLAYIPTILTIEDRLVAEDRAATVKELSSILKVFPYDLKQYLGEASESKLYVDFERQHSPFPQFSSRLDRLAYWGGTVSFLNLQLAAYLGCKQIIMIGFDHNYQVPKDQIVNHVIQSQEADVNHIHPDYFGPGYRWHDPNVARMEIGYECAKRELERRGVEVLNATVGGHLEVFRRVPYESLF